jgi:alanyl-tRNA synthetase
MNRKQLIKAFIDFYKSKNHREIPNSSLIPINDPTVLFTTAGMHPIVPYLLGQPHPSGKRLCNVQRCIRTVDFDNIGDNCHHTFFEMLGKWSVGDYFKKQAIEYTFEFYTRILKIPIERLGVTCFKGDKNAEKDEEAARIWESLGIKKERIAFLPKEDNWWETPGPGPCGPDTEIFYWKPKDIPAPKKFNPEDKNWVEIGNDVLMQYQKTKEGNYLEARQKNIDFGGGVERTITVLSGLEDNYLSDAFLPIIKEIEHLSKKDYKGNEKTMRIIADHIKASVFIIADGITPSNSEQGYVLRRLIRRTIMNLRKLGFVGNDLINPIAKKVFEIYDDYEILRKRKKEIFKEIDKEENQFNETLENGIREFEKIAKANPRKIPGKDAFLLYQSYGFPFEMTKELAQEKQIKIDEKEFKQELEKHQELSRTATAGVFKSGLADNSEATKKLHTATHLLLAALKKVLKDSDIHQKGSNITPERLRLDFAFPRKITPEELRKIEELVNQKIVESIPVACEKMSLKQAREKGAEGVFEDKYSDMVNVYSAGNFSKEICAGPHVENTSELGNFKIIKEESSSSGVRRIKAVLD